MIRRPLLVIALVGLLGGNQFRVIGEQPSPLPPLNRPIVAAHSTRSGTGYWLIAAEGRVFTFGDAEFLGSMGAVSLNRPVFAGVAGPVSSG